MSMKLSEILKDWPEKKQWFYTELAGPDEFEKRLGQAKIDSANDMLTSCDREIDREALAEALFMFVKNHDNEKTSVSDDIKDFISTMPTWLRKVNNDKK